MRARSFHLFSAPRATSAVLLLVAFGACEQGRLTIDVPAGATAEGVPGAESLPAAEQTAIDASALAVPQQAPGVVYFDSFPGTTTDDKFRSLNTWAAGLGPAVARPAVVFDSKTYTHSVPIQMWSGLTLVGGKRSAVREFSTGTVLHYAGAAGTSQLAFVKNTTSYPSDGSPRELNFISIQFWGNYDTDHVPRNDVGLGGYTGKVIWYSNWRDCGFLGFRTIWWGWGTGSAITGITHLQAVGDTAFYIGGSENHFFENYSYQDSSTTDWAASGKPFFRSRMEKSSIGRMMFSARSNSYQLSIEGGRNLVVDGTAFDAPDSSPTYGKQVSISGGAGITITNSSFKGAMASPTGATGGSAANRALIHITGGSQIVIQGNNFIPNAPIVYVGPNVGLNQVKVGLNGYSGSPTPSMLQAKAGQILCLDPTVSVAVSP